MTRSMKAAGVVLGSTLIATVMPFAQANVSAVAQTQAQTQTAGTVSQAMALTSNSTVAHAGTQSIHDIQGIFSYNQGVSMDNAYLSKFIYGSTRYLCASHTDFGADPIASNAVAGVSQAVASDTTASAATADVTQITVSGDVANSFTESVDDLATKYPANKIMGCTCAGNVIDGRASANAQVEGILLSGVLEQAQPADDANTITFTSADGYTVSLPLSYVKQRYCLIATDLNGQNAQDAVGCSNQLWLGSTAARSFVRDVASIQITHEDVIPDAPGAVDMSNQPNVGVTGSAVGASDDAAGTADGASAGLVSASVKG